jgi:hypothetical protein
LVGLTNAFEAYFSSFYSMDKLDVSNSVRYVDGYVVCPIEILYDFFSRLFRSGIRILLMAEELF